jgi:YVTN family beta-propeller protein
MAINKKRVGEWLITQEEISISQDNPYLDLTSDRQVLSATNFPDLVPYHRNQKYKFGGVSQSDIIDVVYYPGEAHLILSEDEFSTKLIRDIYEDQQYHYTYEGGNADTWNRSITLTNDLKLNGTTMVPAGEYKIKRAEFTSTFLATNDINAVHSGVALQIEFKEGGVEATGTFDIVNSSHNANRVYRALNATNWATVNSSQNPGYMAWTTNNQADNHLVAVSSQDYKFGTGDFTIDAIVKGYNSVYAGSNWFLEKSEPDERRQIRNTYSTSTMRNSPIILGDKLYIGFTDGTLIEFDANTLARLRGTTLAGGTNGVQGMAYDGTYIWIADYDNNRVRKIDVDVNHNAGVMTSSGDISSTISNPYALLYLSGFLYVVNSSANTVSRVDVLNNTVSGTASVGTTPMGIIYDENNFIWVSNFGTNTVSYIDVTNFTASGTVTVGSAPAGMEYHSGYIYVCNYNSNTLSKIDIATKTVVTTFSESYNPLTNPYFVSKTPENTLLITEYGRSAIRVFDLEKQVLSRVFSNYSTNLSSSLMPPLVVSGSAILTNAGNSTIAKMPYSTMWNTFSWRRSDTTRRAGFGTYLSGKVYIPDTVNNQVVVLNTNTGLFENEINLGGGSTGSRTAINVSGFIFVATDTSIVKINPATSGIVGYYSGGVNHRGLVYDNNGYIWTNNVTNSSLHKVDVNTLSGTIYSSVFSTSAHATGSMCILSGYLFTIDANNYLYRLNLSDPTINNARLNSYYTVSCDDNYVYAVRVSSVIEKFDPLMDDWVNASCVDRISPCQDIGYILTRDTVNNTGFWLGTNQTDNNTLMYIDGYAQWTFPISTYTSFNIGGEGTYTYVIPGDSKHSYAVNWGLDSSATGINIIRLKSGPKTDYGMFLHYEDVSSPVRYLIGYYGGPGKVLLNNNTIFNQDTTLNRPDGGDTTTYNYFTRISRKNSKLGMWLWGQYDNTNRYWGNFLKLQNLIDDTKNYNSNYDIYIGGNQLTNNATGPHSLMRYLSITKGKALSFGQSEYAIEPRIVINYSNSLKINGNDTTIMINGKGDRSKNIARALNISTTASQTYINKTPGQTGSSIKGNNGDNQYAQFGVGSLLNFGTSNFTIQMWFKIYSEATGHLIANSDNAGTLAWKLKYNYSVPSGYSRYKNTLEWSGQSYTLTSDDLYNRLRLGKWNHVGISRSGTVLNVYLNGERVITGTDTDNYNSGLPYLFVGKDRASSGTGVAAYYDEVRIDSGVALFSGSGPITYQTRGEIEFYPKRVANQSNVSIHYPISDTYLAINGENSATGLRSRANVGRHRELNYSGIGDDSTIIAMDAGGTYGFNTQGRPLNQGKTNEFSNPAITINKPKTTGVKIYEWVGRYKP